MNANLVCDVHTFAVVLHKFMHFGSPQENQYTLFAAARNLSDRHKLYDIVMDTVLVTSDCLSLSWLTPSPPEKKTNF